VSRRYFSRSTAAIVDAEANDGIKVERLRKLSLKKLCASHYNDKELNAWIECGEGQLREAINNGEQGVFVSRHDSSGMIVGVVRVVINERPHIFSLFVHPSFTALGIGRALVEKAEWYTRSCGYNEIFVSASLNVIPFYLRNNYLSWYGFNHIAKIKGDGTAVLLTACKMSKNLVVQNNLNLAEPIAWASQNGWLGK
jgi:GNAT superfamily N-acetyltransferase